MIDKRVAVVTGGADGLGKEMIKRFMEQGYVACACDFAKDKLEKCREEFDPEVFMGIFMNVTDEESVKAAIGEILDKYGRIDVLVNNAGGSGAISASMEDINYADFQRIINLNLGGTFLCCKYVLPNMKANRYGRIINISSIAGRGRSYFGGVPYASSKAGILGLTRHASRDLGPFGITINAVAPGTSLSGERIRTFWEEKKTEDERQGLLSITPMGRLGTPGDIANAVLFLAGEEAEYITGAVLDVNGGSWVG